MQSARELRIAFNFIPPRRGGWRLMIADFAIDIPPLWGGRLNVIILGFQFVIVGSKSIVIGFGQQKHAFG